MVYVVGCIICFMFIIQFLFDIDLYKFIMMQVVLYQYFGVQVQYWFKCCMFGIDLVCYIDQIDEEIDYLCSLCFSDVELDYMCGLCFVKLDFVDFFGLFYFDCKYIQLCVLKIVFGEIELDIIGLWLYIILFEVLLLVIINEVWFCNIIMVDFVEGECWLQVKVVLLCDIFGFE